MKKRFYIWGMNNTQTHNTMNDFTLSIEPDSGVLVANVQRDGEPVAQYWSMYGEREDDFRTRVETSLQNDLF